MPNSLSTSASASQAYIQVTGSGLWHPDQLERHFRDLDRDLKAMRARTGFARVFADLGEAKVQTAETAQVIKRWTARIYRECDQVAVVCGTQLLAMQIKHQSKISNLRTFRDADTALDWLLSGEAPSAPQRVAQSA